MSKTIQHYPMQIPVPFSKAVRAGDFLFLAGQIPLDANNQPVRDDIRAQARCVMDRIVATLNELNAQLSDVVRVTVWLSDIAQLNDFNEVYRSYFSGNFPVRSTVQARLAFDVGVEIEVQAYLPT